MAKAFSITLTSRAYAHFREFRAFDRRATLDAIQSQLSHEPDVQSRNRKLLRASVLADWELRVGKYRVFYEIDSDRLEVRILAIGIKEGNRLLIGGREIIL